MQLMSLKIQFFHSRYLKVSHKHIMTTHIGKHIEVERRRRTQKQGNMQLMSLKIQFFHSRYLKVSLIKESQIYRTYPNTHANRIKTK
jgi:hypothetical protein